MFKIMIQKLFVVSLLLHLISGCTSEQTEPILQNEETQLTNESSNSQNETEREITKQPQGDDSNIIAKFESLYAKLTIDKQGFVIAADFSGTKIQDSDLSPLRQLKKLKSSTSKRPQSLTTQRRYWQQSQVLKI